MSWRKYSGEWLGVVRRWIQRKYRNGDQVTWGSMDLLEGNSGFVVRDFEELAQDIRNAVVQEFKIKDYDHHYKYRIFCTGEGRFIQYVDNSREAWAAMYGLKGHVAIYLNDDKDITDSKPVVRGDAKDVFDWISKNEL